MQGSPFSGPPTLGRKRRWPILSLRALQRTPGSYRAAFVRSNSRHCLDPSVLIPPPPPRCPQPHSVQTYAAKSSTCLPSPPRAELFEARRTAPERPPSELGSAETWIPELRAEASQTQDLDCPLRAGKDGARRCTWRSTKEGGYGFQNLSRMREHVVHHGLRCLDCNQVFVPARSFKEHRKHKNETGSCSNFNAHNKALPCPVSLPAEAIHAFLERVSQYASEHDAWIEGYKILNPNWEKEGALPSPSYRKNKAREVALSTATSNATQTRAFPTDSPVSAASNASRDRALSVMSALTPTSHMAHNSMLSNTTSGIEMSPLPRSAGASNVTQDNAVPSIGSAPATTPQLLVSAPPTLEERMHDQYPLDYANELSDSVPLLPSDSNAQLEFDHGNWEMDDRHILPSWQSRQSSPFWDMINAQPADPPPFDHSSMLGKTASVAGPVELDAQSTTALMPTLSASTSTNLDASRSRSRSPAARGLSLDTRRVEQNVPAASTGSSGTSQQSNPWSTGTSQQSNPWSTTRISPLTSSSKITTPSSASSMQKRRDAAKHISWLHAHIYKQRIEIRNLRNERDEAEGDKQNALQLLQKINTEVVTFGLWDDESMQSDERLSTLLPTMDRIRTLVRQNGGDDDIIMLPDESIDFGTDVLQQQNDLIDVVL